MGGSNESLLRRASRERAARSAASGRNAVFETLLTTDPRGNLTPSLCEKWEGSDEGRTFVLTLRRDVQFSDGVPLTSKRLKESFETAIGMVSSEMPAAYAAIRGVAEYRAKTADEVSGIVVRGQDKLEVHVLEPLPIYPAMLTDGSTGVVRPVKEAGGEKPRLLGTGPFRLASLHHDKVVLERNPEYWRGVPPLLDVIEFRSFSTANAIAKGFRSSEIDVARDLLPEDLEELLREPRFRRGLVEAPKKNTYFVLFNSVTGPVARNPAVRRALARRVETRDLVWRTLGRLAQPAISLIPPGMLGHDPGKRSHALNRDEALALLRAAGFEPPVRLKASVHPLLQDSYGALLTALFALWSEVGVEVSLATSDMASYLEAWAGRKDLDLLIGRWNADYDDPDNFTHTLFHSRSGTLRRYFSSPESDELLEQARSESRPAVRDSLYRKYESLLAESGALLPLFHDIDYRLASPWVRRLSLRGTAPYVNYSELGKVEAAEPAAEVLRVAGGLVHVPIAGVIHTFDPALSDTIEQQEVLPTIFETLTRDVGGARIVPWLAAEFKVEDGGKRYRFRLREDVRFHDGRRLTARDVRFSFERLLQSGITESRWLFSSIRGARALIQGEAADLAGFKIHSATELSIDLEEPISFFPAILAFHGAAVTPEGSNPAAGSWQEGCVGTGPYRVVKFEPGRRLELERNKTYWRKGYPRSEGLTFSFGVSPEDILSGFRAGRFSLASDLFPPDVETLRREPDFASGYREMPRLITYFAAFAVRHGPLADLGIRRRLVQAVDVPRLVQKTLGRLAIPAEGLIPPGLLGHDPGVVRPRAGSATGRGGGARGAYRIGRTGAPGVLR